MGSSVSLQPQSPDDNGIKFTAVPVVELHAAVTEGNLTKLETILDWFGVDLVSEYHLLHTAASCGQVATVKLLITKYNWPVDCKNEKEQTPLHLACSSGHLDVIRVLVLEYKADMNARDTDSDMPLHTAARHGYTDIIEWFIKSESDMFKCDPSTMGCEGRTILHYACYEGHIELIEVLIKKYLMDPLSNDDNGNNSLHYAVHSGREKIVRTLTNNYTDLHMAMNCRNKYNESPLDVACNNGHLHHIAKLLMFNNGLLTFHDDNLLCAAARYGKINTVNFLINEFKYNPNCRGKDHMTPLQLACRGTHLEVVEMLLS